MSLVVPIIRREPIPRGRQADLDQDSHILRLAPGLPTHVALTIINEALYVLNDRVDLAVYAHRPRPQHRPRLRVVRDHQDTG